MPPPPKSARAISSNGTSDLSTTAAVTATTAATDSPTTVSPSSVPAAATGSSHDVRSPANQREMSLSTGSTVSCSGWVSSQPQPTTTSASTTYANNANSSRLA